MKMKNYTKKKHKENKRKERGKGEKKGAAIATLQQEENSSLSQEKITDSYFWIF